MRENNIDYVMHLAANSDIQASAQNPSIEYENTYSSAAKDYTRSSMNLLKDEEDNF